MTLKLGGSGKTSSKVSQGRGFWLSKEQLPWGRTRAASHVTKPSDPVGRNVSHGAEAND